MKHSLVKLRVAGFLLAGVIAALDQWSKQWIIAAASANTLPLKIFPFFNMTLVFNKGISFGMLANAQAWIGLFLLFCLLTITIMLVFWLVKAQENIVILALGLIIGGAVGNLIDRVRAGSVTDFLDFHIGRYHWPAFNLADSSIFIGVVLFVFTNIIWQKPPQGKPK